MSDVNRGEIDKREAILASHRDLHELLRRIEEDARPEEVLPLLEELRVVLQRHFGLEEGPDGLYEIINAKAPNRNGEVRALLDEHRGMLEDLARLVSRAGSQPTAAQIVGDAGRFSRRLRDHERHESELLVETLSTDMDGRD